MNGSSEARQKEKKGGKKKEEKKERKSYRPSPSTFIAAAVTVLTKL